MSLLGLQAYALPITEKEALLKAQAFMQGKQFQQSAASPKMRRAPQATKASSAYYVFNVEDNGGFVIIAGDDVVEPVIGYATQGNFDGSNLPEDLRDWLEQISAQIQDIAEAPAQSRASSAAPKRAVQNHAAIEPLIITTWNQGNYDNDTNTDGVYNIKCPKIGDQYTCTGCVATAGAQLMYYHKHPKAATKVVPGYQLLNDKGEDVSQGANTSADLPAIQFQWDKMQTSYTYNDPNTEAVNAVAELMLYCGYAARMSYGVDGSGASSFDMVQGLVEYFDYDPNTWQHVSASNYSIADWAELMYNELANERPILYRGNDMNGAGHAFICDGYDGNGYFHFNFGWGGDGNGPYKLYVADEFIQNHEAFIGLQPNTGADPGSKDLVATAYQASFENTTISMLLLNDNSEKCAFGLGFGELNENGTITVLDKEYEYYKNYELSSGNWWTNRLGFDVIDYNLPEGTHKLVPISILQGETEWKRCHPANLWFEVNVAGGQTTVVQHPKYDLAATKFVVPVTPKFSGASLPLDVTIENRADDYVQPLCLFASKAPENRGSSPVYMVGTGIEGGSSAPVRFYFTPETAGTWYFWVSTSSSPTAENVIGQGSVVIEEAPAGTVTLQLTDKKIICMPNGKATYKMTVKNTGETTNYRGVRVYLWIPTGGGNWSTTAVKSSPDKIIEPGELVTFSFTFEGLTDGNEYSFDPRYYTTYQKDNLVRFNEVFYTDHFTYQIPSVVLGDANGDGDVDIADAVYIVNYVVGKPSPDFNEAAADVNGDGDIDIADAVQIVNYVVGKINAL